LLYEAWRLLEQSTAIDPNYARAAAVLSWTQLNAYVEPCDGDHLSPAALERAFRMAETAVRLDARPSNARASSDMCCFLSDNTMSPWPNSSELSRSIPISSTIDTLEPCYLRESL
jgi:hypothetical protein